MKIYKLTEDNAEDDKKLINISEEITSTKEENVTVVMLKKQHLTKLKQIEAFENEADAIVDKLIAIDAEASLDISVSDIPVKVKKNK